MALGVLSDRKVRSSELPLPIPAPSRSRASAIAIESLLVVPSSISDNARFWVPSLPSGSAAAPASKLSTAWVTGTAVR